MSRESDVYKKTGAAKGKHTPSATFTLMLAVCKA